MRKPHGIVIFGANGSGKTTLGRELARILSFKHIDHEDYAFEKSAIPYTAARPREKCMELMLADIQKSRGFVLSAVTGEFGEAIERLYALGISVEAPMDVRVKRVEQRGYEQYGERVSEGGDMYEQKKSFVEFVATRPLARIERYLETLKCPVIRVNGTVDYRQNAASIAKYYQQLSGVNRFTPESQGISSDAVIELADEFERRNYQVTSFMLLRNGYKIAEFCKPPYETDSVQLWFSVTKSFTGIGVGIACDKGLLSLDDRVISFFPDKLPVKISDNLTKMRVRHLLSMTSGIHDNTYAFLYSQEDWVKAFLAQDFPHEPGTFYRYSTHGSHMLAAIVERVTGQSFYEFIKTNLLKTLEIRESTWETDSQGITAGGMGLGLTLESVAKFAQMILNQGVYNGKRIVSEKYLSAAMTEQADNRDQETGRHTNGYGFHMQIDNDGSVFHPGAFGQLWYACPRKNIVVALTSRRTKTYTDEVVDLIQEKIINCASDKELPASPRYEGMMECLKNLKYPVPNFREIPPNTPSLDEKTYLLSNNPQGLKSVAFKQEKTQQLRIRLNFAGRPESVIDACFDKPVHGRDVFVKDLQFHEQKYISYIAWENERTLQLALFYIETPYEVTCKFTFNGTKINVAYAMNVSLNLKNFECEGALSETDRERQARIYPILLSEYNPEWTQWFSAEKTNLEQLIGKENLAGIHHYGSTSVPGLTAKPTVDILLEIKENTDVDKLIASLPTPDYICLSGKGLTMPTPPPHLMFLKGYLSDGFAEKVYHIHVVYPGDHDELWFRDYLKNHPEAVTEYAALKRRLFKDYEHNRDGYTEAKTEFVRYITKLAREGNAL